MTPQRRSDQAVRAVVSIDARMSSLNDLTLHLTGELDGWGAPTLRNALAGLRRCDRDAEGCRGRIFVDLSDVSFLDLGGLTALEELRHALLADGWLVTTGQAQPQVCRLLRFADRSGWLADGPLVAEHPHPHPSVSQAPSLPTALRVATAGLSPRAARLAAEPGALGGAVVQCQECDGSLVIPHETEDVGLGLLVRDFLDTHAPCVTAASVVKRSGAGAG